MGLVRGWLLAAAVMIAVAVWHYTHNSEESVSRDEVASSDPIAPPEMAPRQEGVMEAVPEAAVPPTPIAVSAEPLQEESDPAPPITEAEEENPERNADPAAVAKRDDEEKRLHAFQHDRDLNAP